MLVDRSDGKPRRHREEITEGEAEAIRQLLERRRKKAAPKPESVVEVVAPILPPVWQEYRIDHTAIEKDAAALDNLKASITERLILIAKLAGDEQRRIRDEDDAEALLLLAQ